MAHAIGDIWQEPTTGRWVVQFPKGRMGFPKSKKARAMAFVRNLQDKSVPLGMVREEEPEECSHGAPIDECAYPHDGLKEI